MRDHWADDLERLAIERGGKVGKIRRGAFDDSASQVVGNCHLNFYGSVQTLVIENWTPKTLNRAMRGKIGERIRISRQSHELIAAEAVKQGIRRATTARRVQLMVVFPDQRERPDVDSLWKCLLDGLVHAGLLLDDDYEHCELSPVIYFIGEKQTRIELTDIETKTVRRWPA